MLVINENLLSKKGKTNEELKIDLAVWLYDNDALSIGRAAAFCGMEWPEFIPEMTKRGVSYWDEESIREELEAFAKAQAQSQAA